MWDLIVDNDSVEGKMVRTLVLVTIAVAVAEVGGR